MAGRGGGRALRQAVAEMSAEEAATVEWSAAKLAVLQRAECLGRRLPYWTDGGDGDGQGGRFWPRSAAPLGKQTILCALQAKNLQSGRSKMPPSFDF